jgi:MarR-like DNA-binding transcriptional regulator SgrR of sgrS sRNA
MEKIIKVLILFFLFMTSKICFAEVIIRAPLHANSAVLDPTKLQDISSLWVSRQINCQVMRVIGGTSQLDAAKSIHYVTPTVIHIELKNNINFSDDSNLTSNDVIATFKYLEKNEAEFRNVLDWIEFIHPDGKYGIIIKLKKETPDFLIALSAPHYPIFSAIFLRKAKLNPKNWDFPVGCGHYKISKNDHHFLELSPLGKGFPIRFNFVPASEISPKDVKKYDLIPMIVSGQPEKLDQFHTLKIFDPYQFYFALNTKLPIWKNKENRCSFLSKIDTTSLKAAYKDTVKSADSLIPSGIIGYEQSSEFLQRTLSDYKNKPLPHKKEFCVSFVASSVEEGYRPEYLKMIQKLYPFASTKLISDCSTMNEEIERQKCDGTFLAEKSNYLDAYEFFQSFSSKQAMNPTGYYDPNLANEIIESQNMDNSLHRANAYAQIIKRLTDQCVIYPLFTMPYDKIYIRNQFTAPDLGEGPIDEFPLDKITLKNSMSE